MSMGLRRPVPSAVLVANNSPTNIIRSYCLLTAKHRAVVRCESAL
jgi:hypothetical protein